MSIQLTVVLPDSLKKPVLELEKELDRIDPPKTRGAPRKVSNRDLAARLVYQAFKGASWRSWGDGHDTYRKRFQKLSKEKSFELFFFTTISKS